MTLTLPALLAAAMAASPPANDPAPVRWHTLQIPGGAAGLATAAGLRPRIEAWRLVSVIARRVHAAYGEGRTDPRAVARIEAYLDAAAGGPPATSGGAETGPAEVVPLPLPPETWRRVLSLPSPDDRSLLRALVTDRSAALLYLGLLGLDAETLASIRDPGTVVALRRHAEVFALVAPSLHVRGGRAAPPGGLDAELAWQDVVGAPLEDPPAFFLALLGRDGGRLAVLHAALDDLDPRRLAWALALGAAPGQRIARLRRWRALAAAQADWWNAGDGPFRRPPNDLPAALDALSLAPEGRLRPSDRRAFWDALFAGSDRPAASSGEADAPWLVEQVTGVGPGEGRRRMLAVRFVQRVFGAAAGDEPAGALRAMRGYRTHPALALVLERMGIDDPALHARAAAQGDQLTRGPADRVAVALACLQGALALVDRARQTGVLTAGDARDLVAGLLASPPPVNGHRSAVAAWLERAVLPLLAARTGAPPGSTAEQVAVRALAGERAGERLPQLRWEGLAYRVDLARAESTRILAVRRAQGPPLLDEALAASSADSPGAEPAERRLTEALTALAYAAQLPAPLPGVSEQAARRHELGPARPGGTTEAAPAWSLPQEVSHPGAPWHVRGALLGLDVALAARRLSRTDALPPPEAPSLDPFERQALAEAAALAEPAALEDAGRDALSAALQRGRARVARASADGAERARLAAELGRGNSGLLLEWASRRPLPPAMDGEPPLETAPFTLDELLRAGRAELGTLDAWGIPALRREARLRPRLPPESFREWTLAGRPHEGLVAEHVADLGLRIAEALHDRGLPARLAGPVLWRAAQDMADRAEPAYVEDARALALFARDLPDPRIDDYVATLVGSVLVPETP